MTSFIKRLSKYDNLKGLAIILVVLGHTLAPTRGIEFYAVLTNFVYLIHMPIFFFVSGYFSKTDKNVVIKSIKNLLIPYFIFSIFWIIFSYFVLEINISKIPLLFPVYGLWFLLSLFTMKIILPYLVKIKYIFWISIIMALLIGILPIPSGLLSIVRTISFLPIFLIGHNYKIYQKIFHEKVVKKFSLNKLKNPLLIYLFIIIFLLGAWILASNVSFEAVQLKTSYGSISISWVNDIIQRFFIIIFGIFFALILNNLMCDKTTFLTKLGVTSLSIYILHFYFVRIINLEIYSSPLRFIFGNPLLSGIYVIILVTTILYILSRDFVSNILNNIINIFIRILSNIYAFLITYFKI